MSAESPKAAKAKTVWVRATKPDGLLHLFTNVRFEAEARKVELDNFIEVQIEAGLLEIVDPNA